MKDIAISIAGKLSEYLVNPMLNHARYMFSFNQINRSLYVQKDELIVTQKSVKERMKEARRKTKIIEEPIERWMNDDNNVLQDVEKLEEKTKDNKGCYRVPELPGMKYFSSKNFVYYKSTEHAYNKLPEPSKFDPIGSLSDNSFSRDPMPTPSQGLLIELFPRKLS
ncbi:unnamed protein product [Vicia faba]|uniref:Uncharacterized protein n=1 Tax=Vicia faba TaxID=3906 RepID=A0AAV0YPW4_VICFA|nr:unnamed protein product [Vicia faba]